MGIGLLGGIFDGFQVGLCLVDDGVVRGGARQGWYVLRQVLIEGVGCLRGTDDDPEVLGQGATPCAPHVGSVMVHG